MSKGGEGAVRVDRLERLIKLLATLLDAEGSLTRAQLQEKVPGYPEDPDAGRRTFTRDLETLRSMGIPVETVDPDLGDPDQQYGYQVRREAYELPDPGLTDEEAAALQLALATVRMGDGDAAAMWKLGGGAARLAPGSATATLAGGDDVGVLFGAVAEQRLVRFVYNGEERAVEPWQLASDKGRWYVFGFDHLRGAALRFRVDRIEDGVRTDGPPGAFTAASPPGSGRPPPPWLFGDSDAVEARLLVDPELADQVQARAGAESSVVTRRPDGAVELAIPVRNREAFIGFALDLLDRAEVLGPPDLRAEVVAWLEAQL